MLGLGSFLSTKSRNHWKRRAVQFIVSKLTH
jgi:hypothetical protein